MHCDTLKQDNDSTARGDGGSRVGEVRANTTSPMPEHKGKDTVTPTRPTDGLHSSPISLVDVILRCSNLIIPGTKWLYL